MKFLFGIILSVVVTSLDSVPGVEIVQDSTVSVMLDEAMYGKKQQKAKTEALDLETRLKDKISQTIYVQYVSPFWKVRLGDFRSYDEAKEYKKLFVQQYPSLMGDTYIVRDKISVLQ